MLTQILIAIPVFLIAITLLVAVHEFGHFLVARKLGVKVLRFSIGFGKPIWRKTPKNGETEYVISVLPLGGYVKMLDERFIDESSGESIAPADLSRAYNRQSVWKRLLILFAGPAANFIFAIAAFYLLFMWGVQEYKPYIAPVDKSSPAAMAGLEPGDEVISVNNTAVQSLDDLVIGLVDGVISYEQLSLEVRRDDDTLLIQLNVPAELASLEDPKKLLIGLGIQRWLPNYYPVIVQVLEDSSAMQAGLQSGDVIKRIDSVELTSVQSFITQVQDRPSERVELLIIREGESIRKRVKLTERLINTEKIGIIGASLRMPEDVVEQIRNRRRFGILSSFTKACESTYAMSALSLKMFREMLFGKVSIKNLSGPLSIAQEASYSAQSGLDQFIKFLALISIALGIVNLLPIPMLDGGQIVFNVMELVKGSPVSERTELIFQQMGIICIFLIMGLAIYNDFERLLF